MSAKGVNTIRTAYEEFARHDAAAVLAKLDASVEWIEGGGGGDSPSGTFIGPDAVASEVFAVIGANFDEYHVDPSEYIDQGSRGGGRRRAQHRLRARV
jgi:ketosteroid isomerase-like protein